MSIVEDILQTVSIGLVVAFFLLNTGRAPKAIEVCKECLIFLNYRVVNMEEEILYLPYIGIYKTIFRAYCLIDDHTEALIYGRKLLNIYCQCGKKEEEGNLTILLANKYRQLYRYEEATKLYVTAINITKEMGERKKEAFANVMVGTIYYHLGDYDKAKEYLERALDIRIEIGDKEREASSYKNLGTVFQSLGQYDKARECLEKALAIKIEIRDKEGEASSYGNLGTVSYSLGQYDKAREYLEKALAIRIEIGDKEGEASSYGNLGTVFQSLGQYEKAKEYVEKALGIKVQIGDKKGEASSYGNLGTVCQSLGQYHKAREYLEKALGIRKQIGDREGEGGDYGNLAVLYQSVGEFVTAEGYCEMALSIIRDIQDLEKEVKILCLVTVVKLCQYKVKEAFDCLLLSMEKSESLRIFLRNNDDFKASFSDVHHFPYRSLSAYFCLRGNPNHGLYVLELARARALADLMSSQYFAESQISADPQTWSGIENIMKQESNSSCLYISYNAYNLFFLGSQDKWNHSFPNNNS